MKVECIVSCLTIVEVDTEGSPPSDAIVEAMAKHEFFCGLSKLTPDHLSVEILENETPSGPFSSYAVTAETPNGPFPNYVERRVETHQQIEDK
jgi:hypothetical protein